MVKATRSASIRMAGQTGITIILITCYAFMFRVCLTLFMTCQTGKYGIISWIRMAIAALIPLTVMCSTVYRKIESVMIKRRRLPCALRMAFFAISRKLCCLMVWIISLIVIFCMTSVTSIGCIIIISVMARKAVGSNSGMCPN